MNVAKIGQQVHILPCVCKMACLLMCLQTIHSYNPCVQLAGQGHSFTLLLSSQESASRQVLEQRISGDMQILSYPGDPAFVPLRSWVAANDPLAARDPAKVQLTFHCLPAKGNAHSAAKPMQLPSMAVLDPGGHGSS